MFNPKPRFPKIRPLPEHIPPADFEFLGAGSDLDYCAGICRRADMIVAWLYGAGGKIPHGFLDPYGFAATCIDSTNRNRIRRVLIRRLLNNDVRRGRASILALGGKLQIVAHKKGHFAPACTALWKAKQSSF
jgi:hypothetical protein